MGIKKGMKGSAKGSAKKNTAKILTVKKRRFVEEYCSNGFNATNAATTAGYSAKTARQAASRLLSNVNIQDAIESFMSTVREHALITTEDIVRGLMIESTYHGLEASHAARVSAFKALTDFTGGFDNNKQKSDSTVVIIPADDEQW